MDGILVVDKPQGWTSFDVCAKLRNLTQTKKVGHSGTLDPMATGVLPVFFGKATKSIQNFMADDKVYIGEMVLGVSTDTGDAEGQITNNRSLGVARDAEPVEASQITNNTKVTIAEIQNLFRKYTGEIEQIPPMFSAKKINGQPLYKLARKGIIVERQPRKVVIHELRLTPDVSCLPAGTAPDACPEDTRGATATAGRVPFYVHCSKGTYIRQLVVDIGDELGCGAHLSALRRIKSGKFTIEEAISMDTALQLAGEGKLHDRVQSI